MKKVLLFLLLLHYSVRNYTVENSIVLESAIIKIADGSLIDADKIEALRLFRRMIVNIILGELLPTGERKGKYLLGETYYGVQDLARIEREIKNTKDTTIENDLLAPLAQAKADFIAQSKEFLDSSRGSKGILVILIQEDCHKRNRPDSLLLDWAKTKEGQEAAMFETRITSFEQYYHFCSDLVNFLLDLIHSCPNAEAQFKERVAKWSTIKDIFPLAIKKVRIKSENINENDFLKYVKEHYIDHLLLHEITLATVTPLLKEYIKHTQMHAAH